MFKTSGSCAAFLGNYDTKSSATVSFGNGKYDLPPWSISILPDCKTEVFNTARVRQYFLPSLFYYMKECSWKLFVQNFSVTNIFLIRIVMFSTSVVQGQKH